MAYTHADLNGTVLRPHSIYPIFCSCLEQNFFFNSLLKITDLELLCLIILLQILECTPFFSIQLILDFHDKLYGTHFPPSFMGNREGQAISLLCFMILFFGTRCWCWSWLTENFIFIAIMEWNLVFNLHFEFLRIN